MAYIQIGRVSKTHGIDGALKLKINERYFDDFEGAEVLFVELAGKYVPYFVEETRGGLDPIVKFEDLDQREEAQKLSGKPLFLRESDLLPIEEGSALEQFERYQGYTLIDETLGEIGPIEEIMEMPGQYMAACQYQGREVMIPLNKVFIKGVDAGQKVLKMDLPEGLLEL
jgi:16S rRNA processing protein RimM